MIITLAITPPTIPPAWEVIPLEEEEEPSSELVPLEDMLSGDDFWGAGEAADDWARGWKGIVAARIMEEDADAEGDGCGGFGEVD